MIKPQRLFLMQRMSSRGMALQLVGICQLVHQFTSVYMDLFCLTDCPAVAPWGVAISTPVLSAEVVGPAGSRQACSLWLCAGPQVKLTSTRTSLHHSLLQHQTHSVRRVLSRSMTS
jgi:hypothetical protein